MVKLVGREAVMDKLVYTATNPVADHLVERAHHDLERTAWRRCCPDARCARRDLCTSWTRLKPTPARWRPLDPLGGGETS
jgi:hypothetical protein